MTFLRIKTLPALVAMAALLAACGGGDGDGGVAGGGDGGGDGPGPGTGTHTLTVQAQGLPEGATLPLIRGGDTENLSTDRASTSLSGNNYTIKLGKLALANDTQYLVSCTFAEPLAGTLQADGSLQVALNADASQAVQCQSRIFALLEPTQSVNLNTRLELVVANLDGTQAERVLSGKLRSSSTTANSRAVLMGNEIYLGATDQLNSPTGYELRATDGSEAGTRLVKNINVEQRDGIGGNSNPTSLTVLDDKLYFIAADGGELSSSQLWVTDGTEAGTQKVSLDGQSLTTPESLVVAGSNLFFKSQSKVYAVDGTGVVTALGPTTFGSLRSVGSRVYFTTEDGKNWLSDGTIAGTREFSVAYPFDTPVEMNGVLYFSGARTADDVAQLWKSDGTEGGTSLVKAVTRIANMNVLDGKLIFTVNDRGGTGSEWWTSDGTEAGTQMVKDAIPGSQGLDAQGTQRIGGRLVFLSREGAATTEPLYVWVTDGTAEGTHRLSGPGKDAFALRNVAAPYWLKVAPDRLLFTLHKGGADSLVGEVWMTDGTSEGTKPLLDKNGQQVEVYETEANAL